MLHQIKSFLNPLEAIDWLVYIKVHGGMTP
jgi:hypothetical protein